MSRGRADRAVGVLGLLAPGLDPLPVTDVEAFLDDHWRLKPHVLARFPHQAPAAVCRSRDCHVRSYGGAALDAADDHAIYQVLTDTRDFQSDEDGLPERRLTLEPTSRPPACRR